MKIRILPLEAEALSLLDDAGFHIVSREIHRARFEGQERGESLYLIAWAESRQGREAWFGPSAGKSAVEAPGGTSRKGDAGLGDARREAGKCAVEASCGTSHEGDESLGHARREAGEVATGARSHESRKGDEGFAHIRQQIGDVRPGLGPGCWRPVGRAYLKWLGSEIEPMASRLESCPEVEDLFVVPELRSRGIGSKILKEAERRAQEAGYPRIGLGVAAENERARALYDRQGYVDAGLGRYIDAGSFTDSAGRRKSWADVCDYLVKAM